VLKLTIAASLVMLLGLSACSDDPYERSVEAPEDEHDPTEVEEIQPPAETAAPRPQQREPLQVTEDEVIDPPAPPNPSGDPEDATKAPLDPPSQSQQIDPTGEPVDSALPDEPTQSMDPTDSYAIDPVDEPLVNGNGEEERDQ
jgi:PBP1b-binding outer membrane lipoprotein LpoB